MEREDDAERPRGGWQVFSSANAVAEGLAVYAGTGFSVLLLSIYGPVAWNLHVWFSRAIEDERQAVAPESFDVPEWLAQHGVWTTPLSLLATGAAMLSPLLAGVLAGLVKLL